MQIQSPTWSTTWGGKMTVSIILLTETSKTSQKTFSNVNNSQMVHVIVTKSKRWPHKVKLIFHTNNFRSYKKYCLTAHPNFQIQTTYISLVHLVNILTWRAFFRDTLTSISGIVLTLSQCCYQVVYYIPPPCCKVWWTAHIHVKNDLCIFWAYGHPEIWSHLCAVCQAVVACKQHYKTGTALLHGHCIHDVNCLQAFHSIISCQ